MASVTNSNGDQGGRVLLNSGQVRARLGEISPMGLWRWRNDPGLRFPKPLTINGRNYWRSGELASWIDDQGRMPVAAPAEGALA